MNIPTPFSAEFHYLQGKKNKNFKIFLAFLYLYTQLFLATSTFAVYSTLFSSKALNGSSSFVGALCIWRLAHFNKIGVEEQRPCANPFFKSLHNWKNSSSEKLIFQFPFVFWDTFISYLAMKILWWSLTFSHQNDEKKILPQNAQWARKL